MGHLGGGGQGDKVRGGTVSSRRAGEFIVVLKGACAPSPVKWGSFLGPHRWLSDYTSLMSKTVFLLQKGEDSFGVRLILGLLTQDALFPTFPDAGWGVGGEWVGEAVLPQGVGAGGGGGQAGIPQCPGWAWGAGTAWATRACRYL